MPVTLPFPLLTKLKSAGGSVAKENQRKSLEIKRRTTEIPKKIKKIKTISYQSCSRLRRGDFRYTTTLFKSISCSIYVRTSGKAILATEQYFSKQVLIYRNLFVPPARRFQVHNDTFQNISYWNPMAINENSWRLKDAVDKSIPLLCYPPLGPPHVTGITLLHKKLFS